MLIGNSPPKRAKSPIFEWTKEKKTAEMRRNGNVGGQVQINRIDLKRTATVQILYAESPSCIWARLPNHIADSQLRITEPYNLDPIKVDRNNASDLVDQYYLAPHEDEEQSKGYCRCRVLKAVTDGLDVLVQVIYIDHGEIKWMSAKVLAELPPTFPYHPWQAILLSLTNVRKTEFNFESDDNFDIGESYWSEEECDTFREVLSQYDTFLMKVLMGSAVRNDYQEPIRVSMRGLRTTKCPKKGILERKTVDVAQQFASCFDGSLETFDVPDASLVPTIFFERDMTPPSRDEIPEAFLHFPSNWRREVKVDNPLLVDSTEWEDWAVQRTQIATVTPEWLSNNGYFDHLTASFWVNVEGANTVSPYEWYARPIKCVKKTYTTEEKAEMEEILKASGATLEDQEGMPDPTESMLQANEELKERAAELDAFYSIGGNRNVLEKEQVKESLEIGLRVYGITCASEERMAYTGEWQRVEVFKYDEFAHVRYLDSGGRDTIAPCNLYKLHPRHASYPPLCVQLCLHGICDPDINNRDKKLWDVARTKMLNSLLRVDVPVLISILDQPHADRKGAVSRTFEEPHVLYARSVTILGESGVLEDLMCNQAGKGRASKDLTQPITEEELKK